MGAQTASSLQYAQAWQKARAAGNMLEIERHRRQITRRVPRPPLCAPKDVAKRKPGSPEGRIALLHAVAHIELNAGSALGYYRWFSKTCLPTGFFDDWVQAAAEESKHFN